MSPTDRPGLAPADPLKREVQAVLREDDGSLSNPRYAGGPGRFDGYGYVAAEAYFHLAGGREAGLRSMQLLHRGTSRWWLEDAKGRVVDLALARGDKPDFPYERGKAEASANAISLGATEELQSSQRRATVITPRRPHRATPGIDCTPRRGV